MSEYHVRSEHLEIGKCQMCRPAPSSISHIVMEGGNRKTFEARNKTETASVKKFSSIS